MTDPQRLKDEFRRAIQDAQASPVRWERVAILRRRRALWGLTTLILLGIALTLLVSLGAFAGKSALDPSYRPPLLSNASGNVDLHEPELGWALFEASAASVSGYLMTADLDLHGLKNTKLVAKWIVRDAGGRKPEDSFRRLIVPHANSESRSIEQLVSRPEHTGLYRVRMILKSAGGRILDEDQTDAIYVIGTDCCRRYKTPMYTSLLPREWHLDEDFAPNPEERFVTLAIGPAENSLDIDTSLIDPENKGGNPLQNARELERLLSRNGAEYHRLAWHRYRLKGNLTVEWSYRLEGDAFTDIFFYRGPSGFAVLGRSAPAHFRETRDLTRMVANSIDPS